MRNDLFRRFLISSALLTGLVSVSVYADGPTRLVLTGGGFRPERAMKQFAEWAGDANAKVLIIGWSSEQPEVYFKTISDDLRKQGVTQFDASLRGPATEAEVKAFTENFLKQLESATGVFFTGGDQKKHMRVIELPGIREAIEAKYGAGFVFAGTSAGTAIMSRWMFTGDGAKVARGLGLLPEDVLVDQHGRRKGREIRVKQAMANKKIRKAFLIDENNSFSLIGGHAYEAYGPDWVNLYERDASGKLRITVLHDFDRGQLPKIRVGKACTALLAPVGAI